jgi:hypothetical protein
MAGTDGLSQVKAALGSQQNNEEGAALVRSWIRGVEEARTALVAVGPSIAQAEEEFLDAPAKQAHGWLTQLVERLDFIARKLSTN